MEFISDTAPEGVQEKVCYDRSLFPLYIVKGTLSYFPDLSAICHWHEDLEFLVMLDGYMDYRVNGEVMHLEAGEGIFVNSRQLHYGYTRDGSDCTYLCLLLSPTIVQVNPYITERFLVPLMNNSRFPAALLRPGLHWQREVLTLLCQTYQIYQAQQEGFELEIDACYLQILALLCRNMPPQEPQSPVSAAAQTSLLRMREMLRYAETHLSEAVSLPQLAAAAHVSVSTCSSLFRHYLGRTPLEYLTALRLEQSCTLLRETRLSMTEIAYRTGFSGSSYFSERFRQQYGCSPSVFRRQAAQQQPGQPLYRSPGSGLRPEDTPTRQS